MKGIIFVLEYPVPSAGHMNLGQVFQKNKNIGRSDVFFRRAHEFVMDQSFYLLLEQRPYLWVPRNTSQQHWLTNVGGRTKCPAVTDRKRGQSPEGMTETRCPIITCFVLQSGVTSASSDIMSHDHSYSMWKPTKSAVLQPSHLRMCTFRCQLLHHYNLRSFLLYILFSDLPITNLTPSIRVKTVLSFVHFCATIE